MGNSRHHLDSSHSFRRGWFTALARLSLWGLLAGRWQPNCSVIVIDENGGQYRRCFVIAS